MGGEPASRYRSPNAAGRRMPAAMPDPALGTNAGHAGRTTGGLSRRAYSLEQIRTFLAVATREHVTQAAQVLCVSQSAVTQQVQLLERALGIQLLERFGRNIRLTSVGVDVAAACLPIVRALDDLENMVQSLRNLHSGAVRVGASQLAATCFLPPVIAEFTRAHPQVNLAVVVAPRDDLCRRVSAGELDCALVDGMPAPIANLQRIWVTATEVVIVAHPSRAGWAVDEDLLPSCCGVAWAPRSAGPPATEASGEGDPPGPPLLRLDCMETARGLVRGNPDFIAAMPLVGVREDLASGALARLGPRSEPLPVFAVRREGADSPAREALWRLLIRKPG